jgi:hypothetical protein
MSTASVPTDFHRPCGPAAYHLGHHRYTVRGITGWRRAIGGQSGRSCDRPLSRGRVRIHWYNSPYRPYRRTHSTSGCTLRARLTSLGRRRGQDDAPTTLHTPTDAKLPTSVAIAAVLKRQPRDAPLPASGRRETRTAVASGGQQLHHYSQPSLSDRHAQKDTLPSRPECRSLHLPPFAR